MSHEFLSDKEYIKNVARKMLQRLERTLDDGVPENDEAMARYLRTHDLIFGQKATLASTLASVAQLLIDLDQPAPPPAEERPAHDVLLSAGDIALVESFVRKIKNAPTLKGDLFS